MWYMLWSKSQGTCRVNHCLVHHAAMALHYLARASQSSLCAEADVLVLVGRCKSNA